MTFPFDRFKLQKVMVILALCCQERRAVYYGATWHTFQPKLEKIKKIHPEKIPYISGNGTF